MHTTTLFSTNENNAINQESFIIPITQNNSYNSFSLFRVGFFLKKWFVLGYWIVKQISFNKVLNGSFKAPKRIIIVLSTLKSVIIQHYDGLSYFDAFIDFIIKDSAYPHLLHHEIDGSALTLV